MRISNYPSDALTGSELILASDVDTSTQTYKTVNFSVDTLKAYVNTVIPLTGAGSTIDTEDLTASRALISNASGKVAVSDVTSVELAYLDITTLGTGQASKAVTTSAGNAVKLTGELQLSYAIPQIILEDTTSSRADARILIENDLFKIDTKVHGTSTWNTLFDIDGSSATGKVRCTHGITVSDANGNITLNGGDIENVQLVEMNVMTVTTESGTVESGAVNHIDTLSKLITTSGSAGASTLAAPTANVGLVKVLVFQADGGGDMVTTVTNAGWKSSGTGTITFSDLGDACTLVYSGEKWFVSGNNGCVFA